MSRKMLKAMRSAGWLAILVGAVAAMSCQELAFPTKKGVELPGQVELKGAGATFPEALYEKWFQRFSSKLPGIQVSYDAVGSGEGIKRFLGGQVDFGASDRALTDEEIAKVRGGFQHVPITAGMIGLVYNLPEVPRLQLSREAYAGIFLGKITRWNDPVLAKCNPDWQLPNREISVVARAESSGTTYMFTNHLRAISPEWAEKHGAQELVSWPERILKQQGNEGVAETVKATPGAIGYVDLGTALKARLPAAWLQNKAGTYVEPLLLNGTLALQEAKLPQDGRAYLPDPAGKSAYPIVGYTWLLIHKEYEPPAKQRAVKQLVRWCLLDGQSDCQRLGYVRLPGNVAAQNILALEQAGQ